MKLRLGVACIAAAVVLLAVAITMKGYAMVVAMLGVAFALVGVGLLCEATDPRRKPNQRTAMPDDYALHARAALREYGVEHYAEPPG